MKHFFSLILICIVCVTSFLFPVSANSYDSVHLNSEEESPLKTNSDDIVVKLYGGLFMSAFARQEDITTMIEKSSVSYLIDTSDGGILYKRYSEGGPKTLSFGIFSWDGFYTYAVSPTLVFDSSVKINTTYCLNGAPNHDGFYIYYDTDHGTYILFKEYENSKETYLFPLSNFYEFAKAKKGIDGANIESFEMENYLLSDTPHAVPHQDTNNDEKCDACGSTIPENNDPFPHISKTNTDKPTDKTEETEPSIDKFSKGCSSSVAFSAVVIVGIMSGTALIVKKKEG